MEALTQIQITEEERALCTYYTKEYYRKVLEDLIRKANDEEEKNEEIPF